jgi:hypothetical protein
MLFKQGGNHMEFWDTLSLLKRTPEGGDLIFYSHPSLLGMVPYEDVTLCLEF